jgi:hypothetical protein
MEPLIGLPLSRLLGNLQASKSDAWFKELGRQENAPSHTMVRGMACKIMLHTATSRGLILHWDEIIAVHFQRVQSRFGSPTSSPDQKLRTETLRTRNRPTNAYIEPYFRPFTEDDRAFLLERGDNVTPYLIPKLGKHYSKQWAEEDGGLVSFASPAPPTTSSAVNHSNAHRRQPERQHP